MFFVLINIESQALKLLSCYTFYPIRHIFSFGLQKTKLQY